MTLFAILGATENAEVENAALEKAAPDNMAAVDNIVAKTTSDFNSDRTIRQYVHGLLLESPLEPSSTDRWAVRAKIRQKRRSRWL